ncbi:MAG: hypothetical protein QHH43_01305 [Candidatus Saccharicenans sp.]|nr:hypothetical protein [Candidatus Saccharicenans sp.]MDH7574381.1 hypothetical protein [Candidatus Saccharicenans sp.]
MKCPEDREKARELPDFLFDYIKAGRVISCLRPEWGQKSAL